VKAWLLDTGPLVAYLDSRDPSHVQVAACWDAFRGRLVTTSAVITEAMYFVSSDRRGPGHLAELVVAAGIDVYDLCGGPELREAAALMEKYADTPMDFADATVVLLAEALDVRDVLTLDRRGFSVYRTRKRGILRQVLDAKQDLPLEPSDPIAGRRMGKTSSIARIAAVRQRSFRAQRADRIDG
jgi:predicted nucleic acid-binding protein